MKGAGGALWRLRKARDTKVAAARGALGWSSTAVAGALGPTMCPLSPAPPNKPTHLCKSLGLRATPSLVRRLLCAWWVPPPCCSPGALLHACRRGWRCSQARHRCELGTGGCGREPSRVHGRRRHIAGGNEHSRLKPIPRHPAENRLVTGPSHLPALRARNYTGLDASAVSHGRAQRQPAALVLRPQPGRGNITSLALVLSRSRLEPPVGDKRSAATCRWAAPAACWYRTRACSLQVPVARGWRARRMPVHLNIGSCCRLVRWECLVSARKRGGGDSTLQAQHPQRRGGGCWISRAAPGPQPFLRFFPFL